MMDMNWNADDVLDCLDMTVPNMLLVMPVMPVMPVMLVISAPTRVPISLRHIPCTVNLVADDHQRETAGRQIAGVRTIPGGDRRLIDHPCNFLEISSYFQLYTLLATRV